MRSYVDELREDAEQTIAAMQAAAIAARAAHAKAELMRHMLSTARKMEGKAEAEAIALIRREWMLAWHLAEADWPHLAREIEKLTAAFVAHARAPGPQSDADIRAGADALESALAREGTSIADQMAWRSQCAHGWWALVAPVPADLPGRKDRPSIPARDPERPFWENGCAAFCG